MSPSRELALASSFATVDDPRIERTKAHNLLDSIIITMCAVFCGADDWVGVAEFGTSKEAWLKDMLELPNGIPSHDTFGRVFARIDPDQFQQRVLPWIQAIQTMHTDRTGNAPQNMGVVRHIALNRLRQEPSKGSVKTKLSATRLVLIICVRLITTPPARAGAPPGSMRRHRAIQDDAHPPTRRGPMASGSNGSR
ncbi:ISAs1 family transposase [Candidatus Chloroploca asiatica]|uniref:H repeat-associated protein N-terminal domain-containing protein n=1 Tax=Candidatus Chloroploca asiatica TaxID=1506545 RepID=A0A2H3L7L8_9CHLR|nr:hypothetical protein A9Q02_22830 [Candidatus Chloroploca asiatica]